MKLFVDADACPVTAIAENTAEKFNIPSVLVCDTAHVIKSDYSEVITASKGADSADFVLLSLVNKGDIVVTQDYGLAALCLSKGACALNQNGMIYSDDNIDMLLDMRYVGRKLRQAKVRMKGPSKRTKEDDERFEKTLNDLISSK